MKHVKILLGLAFTALLILSCRKEISDPEIASSKQIPEESFIPPFPFAWETADHMPTPPGISILVPWASGSNRNFPIDIAYDFKQSEGWELVYNTFNTTALTSPSYFALYNRYRGLLRFYLYLFPSAPTASTYINHGINITGSATPHILNYIGQDVVDINTKQRSTTGIQNYQLQSTGGWYVMQYEIAYDPSISNTPYQNLDFQWYSKSVNITEVNLSGSISGTLKGSITQPGSVPSVQGVLTTATKGLWEGIALSHLTIGATGLLPYQEQNVISAANNGLQGIVKNIFSALFGGGGGGSSQQVLLNLNAQIGLAGSFINSTGLANTSLVIPGLQNGLSSPGYTPGYNSPMGVFYLTAKPKIKIVDIVSGNGISIPGGYGAQAIPHKHTYSIDNTSFTTLINPAVINSTSTGAQIQNFKRELILIEPASYANGYNVPSIVTSDGTVEQVGNYNDVRVDLTNSTRYQSSYGSATPFHQSHGKLGIRFSFDVVPNNGSARTKMVKTFWAESIFL